MNASLREFIRREIELKQRLPFGEWIRHVRDSHDELLRLLTDDDEGGAIRIERIYQRGGAELADAIELPASCYRIVVDGENIYGFSIDTGGEKRTDGVLVERRPFTPEAAAIGRKCAENR